MKAFQNDNVDEDGVDDDGESYDSAKGKPAATGSAGLLNQSSKLLPRATTVGRDRSDKDQSSKGKKKPPRLLLDKK